MTTDPTSASSDRYWTKVNGPPSNPERFDSMYTNVHGERWWCRIDGDELLVWGVDVDHQVAKCCLKTMGVPPSAPWVMHAEENMWLAINLSRANELAGRTRRPIDSSYDELGRRVAAAVISYQSGSSLQSTYKKMKEMPAIGPLWTRAGRWLQSRMAGWNLTSPDF